jgi:predicted transcriptional regulator
MPRKASSRPTDFELEILSVLWARGDSLIRDIHEALLPSKPDLSRATVAKIMDVMIGKGFIEQISDRRPLYFRAILSQAPTQKSLVRDLLDRVFKGSPTHLVLQALSTKRASREERERIRQMLDKLDETDPKK